MKNSIVELMFETNKRSLVNLVDKNINSFMTTADILSQPIPFHMFNNWDNSTTSSDDIDSDKDDMSSLIQNDSMEQNRYMDIFEEQDKAWSEPEEI